jgi:hypothetical protein
MIRFSHLTPALVITLAAPAFAGTFTLSGTATVVHNAPAPHPDAVRLTTTADTAGSILYTPTPLALAFNQITNLSLDLDLAQGTTVAQSPRLTLSHFALDGSGFKNVYVTLTPDVLNAWTSTGNLIDPASTAPIWDLHELSDSPDAFALTYAEALGVLRATSISFISLDVDAGALQLQTLFANNFRVNDDILTIEPVPEPLSAGMLAAGALALFARRRRAR